MPHASLLFRFLLHATLLLFILVVAFFVSCFFFFVLAVFAFISFTGLWVFFPLARFSSFFRFLCHSTFTPSHAWFFRFFCQFRYRIIWLCVQCPYFSVSCVFHFGPLLLFVAFGIARFCSLGPSWTTLSVCSCSCLVFVALSRALFSHSFSCFFCFFFSVLACLVLSVGFRLLVWRASFGFPGVWCFFSCSGICFLLLVYRAFAVARVSSVSSCSCVKPFQLLVRLAFSVARVSSSLSFSCV